MFPLLITGILALMVLGIGYTLLYHKKMTVPAALILLVGLFTTYGVCRLDVRSEKLNVMEIQRLNSDIENQGALTNGLYNVLGVWKSPSGGYLAVLHPTLITDVDLRSRSVGFSNIGKVPRLVSLDTVLTAPGASGFSGFAEVYTGPQGSVIRDYKPFEHLPEK